MFAMKKIIFILTLLLSGMEIMAQTAQGTVTSGQWMLGYAGKDPGDVVASKNFARLLKNSVPGYIVAWDARPLPQLIEDALSGSYYDDPVSSVTVQSKRFVSVTNTMRGEADLKVLFWCDVAKEPPAVLFLMMWLTQANNGFTGSASLDIYTKHAQGTVSLPPQFIASVHDLMQKTHVKSIEEITFHDAQNHQTKLSPSILSLK